MNALVRWGRFNLVGAVGMGVQLVALSCFNRMVPGHYLCATAAAIELTLLHNFFWHLHYTWRDRREYFSPGVQLIRFHLSSGVISLTGNLVIMRLLVQQMHIALIPSNATAILCCSIANFCLGNNWAFAGPPKQSDAR